MRLMTWNCRGGKFRHKAALVAPLRPDVLVIPEAESLDRVLLLAGECQPTFRNRLRTEAGSMAAARRSIEVFSYTGTDLKAVDEAHPIFGFRRFEALHGELRFNVAAVWTYATKSRETHYKQSHEGLQRYAAWIRERPTVVLGDFNDNLSFKATNLSQMFELTEALGLKSAYHEFFGERFGQESRPTYYHRARLAEPFHIDYCFIPAGWVPRIAEVRVGTHAEWSEASDHVPLVVDLRL